MQIKKGYKQMLAEANAEIETLSVAEAAALQGRDDVPRGMLEFWVDPESPYHKPIFAEDKRFVFFCAGGWRSALAAKTARDMGIEKVAHIDGGFTEWKKVGAPIEPPKPR